MRIYSVSFREYDDPFSKTTVSRIVEGRKEKVKTDKQGHLIVPEFDIQRYESFGRGFDLVRYVGELDDRYFLGITSFEVERAVEKTKHDVALCPSCKINPAQYGGTGGRCGPCQYREAGRDYPGTVKCS